MSATPANPRQLTPELVACALTFKKSEVCALTGVQPDTVEAWVKAGLLKVRWLNSRNILFEGDSVRSLVNNLAVDAPAPRSLKARRLA